MHPKDPQNMVANGSGGWPCSPGPIAKGVASALGLSGHTLHSWSREGHDCMLQVLRKLEDQPLPLAYMISGLVTTLVGHFGSVPLSDARWSTDADILKQGIESFSPAEDERA